jgi:TolA-binding protein
MIHSQEGLKSLLRGGWLLAVLIVVGSLSGCFVSDFVSQRYENSVAYFNTYYNATRLFDDAVLEIRTTEQSQRSKGLPPQKEISPTAKQKLTTVIEKCSKLLQYHPTSKWVDGALMLIGESYYYMGEYLRAERKFAELIAQFPQSDRFLEARLWLGKSFRRGDELDAATRELSAVADTAVIASEKAIAAQAYLELGEIYTEQKSYDGAIKAYQDLIDKSDYGELKAEAQFRLAQLNENTGDFQKAADGFRKVADFNPDSYQLLQSRFRYALDKKRLKQFDEALHVLHNLLDDRSNVDFFPQIKLEIGNVLKETGNTEGAIEAYTVVDTTYRKTEAAAKAYYSLGLLYEKALHNYAAAETNYVRARTEFASSDVSIAAGEHGDNLRKYFLSRRMISNLDSSIVTEQQRPDGERDTARTERPDSVVDSLAAKTHPPWQLHTELWDTTASNAAIRTLKLQLAKQTYDLGVLFFLDLDEPDSALYWCERTLRLSADSELSARTLYTLAEIDRAVEPSNQTHRDSLYRKIISDYPNTRYGDEAERILGFQVKRPSVDSAAITYRRAEKLLDEKKPDEAIRVLRTLLKNYPTSPYSPKSRYAIGWIYENIEDLPDSAIRNYKTLVSVYPSSKYSSTVKPMLAERDRWVNENRLKHDSTSADSLSRKSQTGVAPNNLPTVSALRDSTAQHDTTKLEGTGLEKELGNEGKTQFQEMKADTTKKRFE